MKHTQARLAHEIRERIATILRERVGDPRLEGVTINEVRVAPDGSYARVFWVTLGPPASAAGSTIRTDGLNHYAGLAGYTHHVIVVKKQAATASQLLPHVHRVVTLLKHWLLGTHQGAVGPAHLDYYLDEFTFRFNRRNSASRGKLFYRLVQQAVQIEPQPYRSLVQPQPVGVG